MNVFLHTLGESLTFGNLFYLAVGSVIGTVIGAIPGLSVTIAVALAVPFTLQLGMIPSMFLLLSLYAAGIYGGSISAILLNAPGTSASAATSLDGYQLARKGHAKKALQMAIYASAYGGFFSVLVLVLLAPQVARVALSFGPAETCSLLLFALTIVGVLSSGSMLKGLLATALGLILSTVGADPIVAEQRLTFGLPGLYDGIGFIPLLIGLFAISEILMQAEDRFRASPQTMKGSSAVKDDGITREDLRASWVTIIRSGFLGVFIGILPGLGATIASFLGYAEAKRTSKTPEKFGHGAIEGVAASEAANNAVTGATLIPLLALSIPGDTVTAILLGALQIQGVTPGPLIFINFPEVVYAVYIGLFLANLLILVAAWYMVKPLSLVLKVPKDVLYAIIIMLCVAGSYGIRSSVFDIFVAIIAGCVGYGLRKLNVPVAPLLIGVILGGPFEEALRQTLVGSTNGLIAFVSSPTSIVFVALAFGSICLTIYRTMMYGETGRKEA